MFFSGKCQVHKHNVPKKNCTKFPSSITGVVEVSSKKWYLKSVKGTPKDTPSAFPASTSKLKELKKTGFAWMDFRMLINV